ncbi:MAG: carboxypeptidase-like regulatory domain-containing protein [Candidatus Palauibacterales bacterium]|nr:carboxypeptidase-like regulatory domain-containing protein [Candidatus Palauibacterales bacterium]
MSGFLAAALLALPCAAPDSGTAELRGRVRDATASAAVAHAVVEVRSDGGSLRRARTGRDGRYRLRDLPAGWLTVAVRHQGYRESRVRVRVSPGQCLDVDFTVELDPVALPALQVAGLPAPGRVESPAVGSGGRLAGAVGPGSPRLEALRTTPLGGSGLGRAVRRSLRQEPADPSVLYLRGTTAPFKQILLDGAPVQTPFHLSGLLAAQPRGVFGSSRLRSGGPSPRFGGGLLYTLDLETRSAAGETRAAGSVDLLGATARASGPVPGGSYLASARTLHPGRDLGRGSALEGRRYSDGLVRLSTGGEDGLRGSVTGFWNRASTPLVADHGTPTEAEWTNRAGSARIATGSRRTGWRGTLAGSRYRSGLPLREAAADRVAAVVDEQRLVLRREDRRGELEWETGGAMRRKAQRLAFTGGLPAGAGEGTGSAYRLGGFGSARWHVSEAVSLRGGLRADYFSPDGAVRAAPRGAVLLRMGPGTTVRLSAGRVHQLLAGWSTVDASVPSGAPADSAEPATSGPPEPRVAGASRLELRLEHDDGEGLRLGTEGHFRHLEGVSPTALFDTVGVDSAGAFRPMEADPDEGGVFSSGLELWGSWRAEGLRLWANYSLTWLWGAPGASGVSRRFAGRQVLSGGGQVGLPAGFRARASLSGSWGLPMTPLPVTGGDGLSVENPTVSGPGREEEGAAARRGTSPYLRVDARVERVFDTGLFGGRVRLTPYVELINALDRKNSLFHRVPAAGGGLQPVNPVPMLPVVGVSFRALSGSPSGTR